MSDLHCPATLLVVRHAEATYAQPELPDDDGGWLTERGRTQAVDLARALRGRSVSAVYTSELQRAVETGAILARLLGVTSQPRPGLQEFSVGAYAGRPEGHRLVAAVFRRWLDGQLDIGCPGGETATLVIQRFDEALQELADLHRGETAVVVSHGGAMSLAIPQLCDIVPNGLSRAHWVPHCAVAEMSLDADGSALRSWPGSDDPQAAIAGQTAG